MDIEHLLKRGSDTGSGKGLHERKAEKKKQSRDVGNEIVALAQEIGLSAAAAKCGISDTAASKILARALKKLEHLSASDLIDSSKICGIEKCIMSCNTTSIGKIVSASKGQFTEAEIRVVKAQLEKNGVGNWDC